MENVNRMSALESPIALRLPERTHDRRDVSIHKAHKSITAKADVMNMNRNSREFSKPLERSRPKLLSRLLHFPIPVDVASY
jgi:hypothetical protein